MKNQKGFTLVEGLLIMLILSVVGFAAYMVWNNNQNSEQSINNDFLYEACEGGTCSSYFELDNNNMLTVIQNEDVEDNTLNTPAKLYRYNSVAKNASEISIADANEIQIVKLSPEGYTLKRQENNDALLNKPTNPTWHLENNESKVEVQLTLPSSYPSAYVELIGWIKKVAE